MANLQSAEKAQRQSLKKRVFNLRRTRVMRATVKDFLKLVSEKKKDEAQKMIPELYKNIDKAAKRGVIKKNNASRKKSRLSAKVAAL